ncbi:MAG: type II toxin-antitoxin system Phd/YefM family antitoxin [Hyphomicrobiales bacterium]
MSKPLSQKPLSPKPIEIGAYEAKTHLPRILREVAAGQSFTITVRGKPVAELTPKPTRHRMTHKEAVRAMIEFTKRTDRPSLTAEQIKEMIEYGRR